jgi:hypothetical protein
MPRGTKPSGKSSFSGFGMSRDKLPAALRDGRGIFDFGKPKSAAAKAPAAKAPAAKAPARASSSASTFSASAPRRMTAAERKADATRKEPVAPKPRTPKVTVQEAPPARPAAPMKSPERSGNMDKVPFSRAPASKPRAPKVTVQAAPPRPTVGRRENMDTESFGKAFAHYRKAGNKTFTWRGKSYTTKLKEEV